MRFAACESSPYDVDSELFLNKEIPFLLCQAFSWSVKIYVVIYLTLFYPLLWASPACICTACEGYSRSIKSKAVAQMTKNARVIETKLLSVLCNLNL